MDRTYCMPLFFVMRPKPGRPGVYEVCISLSNEQLAPVGKVVDVSAAEIGRATELAMASAVESLKVVWEAKQHERKTEGVTFMQNVTGQA